MMQQGRTHADPLVLHVYEEGNPTPTFLSVGRGFVCKESSIIRKLCTPVDGKDVKKAVVVLPSLCSNRDCCNALSAESVRIFCNFAEYLYTLVRVCVLRKNMKDLAFQYDSDHKRIQDNFETAKDTIVAQHGTEVKKRLRDAAAASKEPLSEEQVSKLTTALEAQLRVDIENAKQYRRDALHALAAEAEAQRSVYAEELKACESACTAQGLTSDTVMSLLVACEVLRAKRVRTACLRFIATEFQQHARRPEWACPLLSRTRAYPDLLVMLADQPNEDVARMLAAADVPTDTDTSATTFATTLAQAQLRDTTPAELTMTTGGDTSVVKVAVEAVPYDAPLLPGAEQTRKPGPGEQTRKPSPKRSESLHMNSTQRFVHGVTGLRPAASPCSTSRTELSSAASTTARSTTTCSSLLTPLNRCGSQVSTDSRATAADMGDTRGTLPARTRGTPQAARPPSATPDKAERTRRRRRSRDAAQSPASTAIRLSRRKCPCCGGPPHDSIHTQASAQHIRRPAVRAATGDVARKLLQEHIRLAKARTPADYTTSLALQALQEEHRAAQRLAEQEQRLAAQQEQRSKNTPSAPPEKAKRRSSSKRRQRTGESAASSLLGPGAGSSPPPPPPRPRAHKEQSAASKDTLAATLAGRGAPASKEVTSRPPPPPPPAHSPERPSRPSSHAAHSSAKAPPTLVDYGAARWPWDDGASINSSCSSIASGASTATSATADSLQVRMASAVDTLHARVRTILATGPTPHSSVVTSPYPSSPDVSHVLPRHQSPSIYMSPPSLSEPLNLQRRAPSTPAPAIHGSPAARGTAPRTDPRAREGVLSYLGPPEASESESEEESEAPATAQDIIARAYAKAAALATEGPAPRMVFDADTLAMVELDSFLGPGATGTRGDGPDFDDEYEYYSDDEPNYPAHPAAPPPPPRAPMPAPAPTSAPSPAPALAPTPASAPAPTPTAPAPAPAPAPTLSTPAPASAPPTRPGAPDAVDDAPGARPAGAAAPTEGGAKGPDGGPVWPENTF